MCLDTKYLIFTSSSEYAVLRVKTEEFNYTVRKAA